MKYLTMAVVGITVASGLTYGTTTYATNAWAGATNTDPLQWGNPKDLANSGYQLNGYDKEDIKYDDWDGLNPDGLFEYYEQGDWEYVWMLVTFPDDGDVSEEIKLKWQLWTQPPGQVIMLYYAKENPNPPPYCDWEYLGNYNGGWDTPAMRTFVYEAYQNNGDAEQVTFLFVTDSVVENLYISNDVTAISEP